MESAIFKFNNGIGALLCSSCRTILKTGTDFSGLEREAQYCTECTNVIESLKADTRISKLIEFVSYDMTSTYIVGGWVRDRLLGIPSDDIDIVVEGNGIAFAKRFADYIGIGADNVVVFERFGTAKIKSEHWDLDFVGARKESYDRLSRNPEVKVGTILDDLSRRDLTINAMSISLNGDTLGQLNDPFDGQSDLKNGIITTPIDPDSTFMDDPLRMLRAIRFAARFNFTIGTDVISSIKTNASRIHLISDERINVELEKILTSQVPKHGFELLDSTGLLGLLLTELVRLKCKETINGVSHKDNYIHTLQVLQNTRYETDDIHLLWTAVLHDIGKSRVKKFDNNSWQFHNHELVSERMINNISARFKWSTDQTSRIKKLIRFHGVPKELCKDNVSDSAIRRFVLDTEDILDDLLLFCSCDITTSDVAKKARQIDALTKLHNRIITIREDDNLRNWKNPVTGDWLMRTTGMLPGKSIGLILGAVKEAIMDGECKNEIVSAQQFALEWIRTNLVKKI